MKYTHIVFDVDGTLASTDEADLRGLQDALRAFTGRDYPPEELTDCLGLPGEDFLQSRFPELDGKAVLRRWEQEMVKYADLCGLYPGVEELIDRLRERGVALGVVTSRTKKELGWGLDPDFLARFGPLISADDTALHKPHPDPLLKYMELTGAAPGEVLYVGDSPYDSRCAHSAGVDFALALWGSGTRADRPAQYYPETPEDLLKLCLPKGC